MWLSSPPLVEVSQRAVLNILGLLVDLSCLIFSDWKLKSLLSSGPDAYGQSPEVLLTQPAASENESRVHTHDHDGSEAPDESPDSILSSLAVELSPTSYRETRVDKYNLLWGGYSDSGISSLWSTGGGRYRDGGSGGSGNVVVTASMRAWVDVIPSVWI
ncbi:hypothetical protein Tco_0386889 [Tanacetum coccineum]